MSKNEVYQHLVRPMRLVFGHPPSDEAAKDQESACEQYAEALSRFSARELALGWAKVRDTHKLKTWPPIGVCVDACASVRRSNSERIPSREIRQGRIVDGVFQPWLGCQCSRCKGKVRREGFHVAPYDTRLKADAERRELDDWITYQRELLPHVKPGETVAQYRARVAAQDIEVTLS